MRSIMNKRIGLRLLYWVFIMLVLIGLIIVSKLLMVKVILIWLICSLILFLICLVNVISVLWLRKIRLSLIKGS